MSDQRFTAFHFTQSNPEGERQDDVPSLLRRVADTIEEIGDVEILDLVLHSELSPEGVDWPAITVYYGEPSGPPVTSAP